MAFAVINVIMSCCLLVDLYITGSLRAEGGQDQFCHPY